MSKIKLSLELKSKSYRIQKYKFIKAILASLFVVIMITLTSACSDQKNTVKNDTSSASKVTSAANTSTLPTMTEEQRIDKAVEAFNNNFKLDKEYTGEPIICDINNDDENEAVIYNTKYKEEDGLYNEIAAAYSLGSYAKISQLVAEPSTGFNIKHIKNPKYKNCIGVAIGVSGFTYTFYRLDGDKFIKFDAIEGEEKWDLVDDDGDGYHEIHTLGYNPNSVGQDDKFIDIVYKWNGDKYTKVKTPAISNSSGSIKSTFKSDKCQYTIDLPDEWIVKSSIPSDRNLYSDVFMRKNDGSLLINILTKDNNESNKFEDIEESYVMTNAKLCFKNLCSSYNITNNKNFILNGYNASITEFEGAVDKSNGKSKEYVTILFTLTDQKIYAICASGFDNDWLDNYSAINKSLSSFIQYESLGTAEEDGYTIGLD